MADLAAIKKQVEYYFSDSNFRRDKFLRAKVAEDPDGWVPLSVLLTFNRLKAMVTSNDDLPAALEDSDDLELSKDKTSVRRVKPLPSEDDSDARSVYVKAPFPTSTTLDTLQTFFAPYGPVARIHMRRTRGKDATAGIFKGSVFVEWATKDACNAFTEAVKEEGKVLFDGRPLQTVEMKLAYFERKKAERDAQKAADKAASGAGKEKREGACVFRCNSVESYT